ncbi:hypothetical protein GCM10011339_18680 [Echinicola rosea]|uniref:Uncharacterized protein n=1 Tax=Echinicola rosea TaxID=1807691 RepID=A0ABQ1UYX5_9BACT|nr:hypothetical protein GCM10011339_18680 [Echinicola rosea]
MVEVGSITVKAESAISIGRSVVWPRIADYHCTAPVYIPTDVSIDIDIGAIVNVDAIIIASPVIAFDIGNPGIIVSVIRIPYVTISVILISKIIGLASVVGKIPVLEIGGP